MQQLDANLILSRMVTANGGAGQPPIRMASIQDFRRSIDKSMGSHPHQQLLLQRPAITPNQAFGLSNRRSSDPYNPGAMGGPKQNPLLKLMEQRMAAAADPQKAVGYNTQIQTGQAAIETSEQGAALQASINKWAGVNSLNEPVQTEQVASPVKLEATAATPEQQAALQASINKWAGIDSRVKARSNHSLASLRSFHNTPAMPSVCENNTLNSSFRSSQPLASRQEEIIRMLLLEQQNEAAASPRLTPHAQGSAPATNLNNLSQMMPVPTKKCTQRSASLAEVERLEFQRQAMQSRINEQFYLQQRSAAAAFLASSNQSLNSLQGTANESSKQLRRIGSYRKRGSESVDDDHETTCTSDSHSVSNTGSHTASNSLTASIRSNASFSKIRRTSGVDIGASMENLRLHNGNYEGMLITKNASFTNVASPFGSSNEFVVTTGVPLNQGLDQSIPNFLKKVPSRKSSIVHSLLSEQGEVRQSRQTKLESPKDISLDQNRPPSVGIDHNLSGQAHCSDKIIMSDLPDRIKYQNAKADVKPMDVVKQALDARGITFTGTKSAFDMPDDFFVKNSEANYQEIVDAIRSNDVDALRKLHSNGTNLQCANKFGESLIHLACRRSHRDVVSFLIDEAGVSLRVRDDFGRTPFHDACWRGELDLELIDMLLEKEPKLLMLSDKRGHSPLDYTRRGHWAELIPFLLDRASKFQPV